MRHRNSGRKLGRNASHRDALFANMVTSLFLHGRIETTEAKAKELRRIADRMITLGKRGDLHARRQAMTVIRSREVAGKVFGDLAERYRTRPGGYTRVLRTRVRVGDAAPLSIVELVEGPPAPKDSAKGGKAGARDAVKGGKTGARKAADKPAKPAARKKAGAGSA